MRYPYRRNGPRRTTSLRPARAGVPAAGPHATIRLPDTRRPAGRDDPRLPGNAAARSRLHSEQPDDEAGTLAPCWAQDLNFQDAYDAGRTAIIVGLTQKDVIAELLDRALAGQQIDPYPVRRTSGFDVLAPLHNVPSSLIGALDLDNCIRNCQWSQRPVSRRQSSMHLLAGYLTERLPALAAELCNPSAGTDARHRPLSSPRSWCTRRTAFAGPGPTGTARCSGSGLMRLA